MPYATITITSEPDGDLGITCEFEPEAKRDETNPLCHHAAIVAMEAIAEWAKS